MSSPYIKLKPSEAAVREDLLKIVGTKCPDGYISDLKGHCVSSKKHYYECDSGYILGDDNLCYPEDCL